MVVLDDAVDLLQEKGDAASTTGVAPLPHLFMDAGKFGIKVFCIVQNLSQISSNLLSNAANFIVCGSFGDDRDLIKATTALGLETRQ